MHDFAMNATTLLFGVPAPTADAAAAGPDFFSTATGLSPAPGGDMGDGADLLSVVATTAVNNLTTEMFSSMHPFKESMQNKLKCGHFTIVGNKLHFTGDVAEECRVWTEGVLSSVVAAFGLMGNAISIWVLSVPEMRNSFNRLLLALAIIDCMFILPGIVIYTQKAFGWRADWYNYAFPVFLYPVSEIFLCSSIYMTVAIAVERYIGLCRPLRRLSSRPVAAKFYIVPVVIIALLLNIPKFLESETTVLPDGKTKVMVTDLRTHPHYITYYWMWTRLLATGVIPLIVLILLNSKIYLSIRHSKQQLRILAIRSALPMAILSKAAPSGAMQDLLQQSGSPPPPGPTNGHASPGRAGGTGNDAVADSDDENAITAIAASPTKKTLVNGRLRQFQRSVSAFEPSAAVRRTLKLRQGDANNVARGSVANNVARGSVATNGSTTWNNNNHRGSAAVTSPPPPQPPAGGADMKLAPILFGVVIVFMLCNCLRVILNIYDFSVLESIISCESKDVGRMPPAWILCSISVSHLLLMVNSSVNFLVYCVAGTRFRRVLTNKLKRAFNKVFRRGGANRGGPTQLEQELLRHHNIAAAAAVRRRHTTMITTALLQQDQQQDQSQRAEDSPKPEAAAAEANEEEATVTVARRPPAEAAAAASASAEDQSQRGRPDETQL